MKEIPKNLVLMILFGIFLSFLITAVSAAETTTIYNKDIYIFSSSSDYSSYTVKATSDNNVVFFDNNQGTVPWTYNTGLEIGSVAISDDGNYVAVGCEGGMVFFFNKNGDILWKRAIGNSFIKSISISKDNKFVDVTTYFNQVLYVTRDGRQIDSTVRWAGIITPTPTQKLAEAIKIAPTITLPIKPESPNDFGNNLFIWFLIAVIVLVVFWAIIKSRQNTQPPIPQKGTIFAKSVPEGAVIYLNGVDQGISPVNIRDLPAGLYTMKATLKGYITDTQQLTITSGQIVWLYTPTLRKSPQPQPTSQVKPTPPLTPRTPSPPRPPVKPTSSFQDLIAKLGAKSQKEREVAQKDLIIKVNTEGKSAIQQIIKELETQPSVIKREIVNLLYYMSKESQDGGKVIEELINALTYSSSDVKWLIIQTLGRIKDKRAIHALEAATSDPDFLVRYWAIISMKNVQES